MAQKSSGSQQGARNKLSKDSRHKTTITDRLKEFEEGDKAVIKIDPSVTKGRVHTRYHGKSVEVTGKRGESNEVQFKEGNNTKTLYIKSVHLQKTK